MLFFHWNFVLFPVRGPLNGDGALNPNMSIFFTEHLLLRADIYNSIVQYYSYSTDNCLIKALTYE